MIGCAVPYEVWPAPFNFKFWTMNSYRMDNQRYTLKQLLAGIKNPCLLLKEGERVLSKGIFKIRYGSGIDVMSKDWDNLIILDACRYDFFAEHIQMDGELKRVISKGSHSREFIQRNFAGRELHDTVLVTANPFVEDLENDVFFRVCYSEVFDRWRDDMKTVPPEAVVDAVLDMRDQYPNKRLIAHFMQPHAPFIGPTGRKLAKNADFGVFNPDLVGYDVPDIGIARAVTEGYVDDIELRRAYRENVEIALENAETLIDRMDGKSVITADHGEMLGERVLIQKRYAHPNKLYTPELRFVPWFVIDGDERRKITSGEPKGFETLDDTVRESRLEDLGYV